MILSRSQIKLGSCATHLRFVGGLVPEDDGRLPRDEKGQIRIVSGIQRLVDLSPVQVDTAQISIMPGASQDDVLEMLQAIRELGVTPDMICMIGGDPGNPDSEDEFVGLAVESLETAKELGISSIASTSFEVWMNTNPVKQGAEYEAAVAQIAKAHTRAYREADLESSEIVTWDLEFLRPVEFTTFTNPKRAWDVVKRINDSIGTNFFRVLIDAAHCGDSGLSMEENIEAIQEIAEGGGLGCFHASAKTTRGCHTTDDGWIGALLTACAETGKLEKVIVEAFDHEDEALGQLRDNVPGHGVDTTDGRSYDQLVADGLGEAARRLNNLVARGILSPA